jgi:sorbitol-specific phosphotransferase system component IIBC
MTIIIAISAVLVIGLLFFIARRALRLVVRLALVFMLVLALLIGGLTWWWYGSDGSSTSKPYGGSPAGTRRSPSR